jgi:hypothetical protein
MVFLLNFIPISKFFVGALLAGGFHLNHKVLQVLIAGSIVVLE